MSGRHLIEGGAEFEDAGADRFHRDGEPLNGGMVEKQDDAIEFAITGASCQNQAEWVEKIPAANLESLFEISHDFFEPVGVERLWIQKKSKLADDVAGGVTGEDSLGIR